MIRLAKENDLVVIMKIYQTARKYMEETGNPTQWGNNHPPGELLEEDIRREQLYVYSESAGGSAAEEENEIIHGVFAFIIGEDPTYAYIEDGTWPNDAAYGTIHRIAGDGKIRGIFEQCFEFCRSQIKKLRIDTHQNNRTMQHLIEKNGFQKCGIVYMEDGSPRIAYQYTLDS